MKVCVDIDYRQDVIVAAGVGFRDWPDAAPSFEQTARFPAQADVYESGQFYRREMPYVLALVGQLRVPVDTIVIDGSVWLEGGRPGLGARLHEALGGAYAVVGVAKRPFRDAANAVALHRGASKAPLFVSAVGVDLGIAVAGVARMHGPHRLPTLLKRVDRLSRE